MRHVAGRSRWTEAQLQEGIITAARRLGWIVHHSRRTTTRRRDGTIVHHTPLSGHPGFPDLVLVRDGRWLVLELKTETGRVSPDQAMWLSTMTSQPRVAELWRSRGAIPDAHVLTDRGWMRLAVQPGMLAGPITVPMLVAVVRPRHWEWVTHMLGER